MGKLALWRAMEGAGKGWGQGIVLKETAEQNKLDRQHQDKLQELRIKANRIDSKARDALYLQNMFERSEQASASILSAEKIAGRQQTGAGERVDAQQEGANARVDAQQEGANKREISSNKSAVEVAKIRGATSSSGAIYKLSKLKTSIMEPGKGLIETERTQITNSRTGETWEQKGDKFFLPDTKIKEIASKEAIKALLIGKDPEGLPVTEAQFLSKFGYLPRSYFKEMNRRGLVDIEGMLEDPFED